MIPATNTELEKFELKDGFIANLKTIDGEVEYKLTELFRTKREDSIMSDVDFGNELVDLMVIELFRDGIKFEKKPSLVLKIKNKTLIWENKAYN